MAVIPLLYAVTGAPVADAHEAAILAQMADRADVDGTATFKSRKTIAARLRCDRQTVERRQAAMEARGLIRRGDQGAAGYIPEEQRPVVYDICIPHSWLAENGHLEAVNEARAAKGMAPVTAACRPDPRPAPAKRQRRDAGRGRPRVALSVVDNSPVDKGGVYETPGVYAAPAVDNSAENGPQIPPPGICETRGVGSTRPPTLIDLKPENLTTDRPVDNFPQQTPTAGRQQADSDDTDFDAEAVASDVLYDLPAWIARRIDRNTRERLVTRVAQLLRGGWMPADLLEEWTRGMDSRRTQSPAGLLVSKLRSLDPSPPRGLGLIGESLSSWCGDEDGAGCRRDWRWVDGRDGLPMPCPRCRPERAQACRRAG